MVAGLERIPSAKRALRITEGREREGFNESIGHLDVMIGSEEVCVTGIGADGKETVLIREGRFEI
jgi:leucyl aminopeptidase (aminopeptidase T)